MLGQPAEQGPLLLETTQHGLARSVDADACRPIELAEQVCRHHPEAVSPRHGREVLQSDPLAPPLDAALVVPFAPPGEARVEQVVAGERQEALGELPLGADDPLDR